jgi:hypothetical protein
MESAQPSMQSLRARARPEVDMIAALANASLCDLKRWSTACRKYMNKTRWQRAQQQRCTVLAAALRAGQRAIGDQYTRRSRSADKVWRLLAHDDQGQEQVAIAIALTRLPNLDAFKEPLEVCVVRPELVDLPRLERDVQRLSPGTSDRETLK